jgi:hypothetical protein
MLNARRMLNADEEAENDRGNAKRHRTTLVSRVFQLSRKSLRFIA